MCIHDIHLSLFVCCFFAVIPLWECFCLDTLKEEHPAFSCHFIIYFGAIIFVAVFCCSATLILIYETNVSLTVIFIFLCQKDELVKDLKRKKQSMR